MPDDFVVFSCERITVFRFIRIGADSWEQLIRGSGGWKFHDNVGNETAKDAFDCGYNEVFYKRK